MRLVVRYLGPVLENGQDLEARSQMAWANTIAGIAIGEGKSSTVGIHALGHSIGGQTDAPHGLTMAAVGPAYMRKTWDADPARYAEVTRILGYAPGRAMKSWPAARRRRWRRRWRSSAAG
jgi:alcohol dehydrogenase class IV